MNRYNDIKKNKREELENKTKDFLKNKGVIQPIPAGVSGEVEEANRKKLTLQEKAKIQHQERIATKQAKKGKKKNAKREETRKSD